MNALMQKHPDEISVLLAKYPGDQGGRRSIVMPLLYLAQHDYGYITKQAIREIAEICELSETEVTSIIGFYSLYYDQPSGKYRVQVCTDLPCALRGAEEFLQKLCENLGIKVGETTPDGMIKVEAVMCLAGCDKAPLFQLQSSEGLEYHENQTVDSAVELISKLRQG